jgi:hypothetical protein
MTTTAMMATVVVMMVMTAMTETKTSLQPRKRVTSGGRRGARYGASIDLIDDGENAAPRSLT